jgi:ParB/RepB/Spo0J family partition protein
VKIPIEKIIVSKDNPRQTFDEESLRRLGESIKTHGQIQPIIVRQHGTDYELVVGERRLRAAALVGLTEIEADVRDMDDSTTMELKLIENTQREDLTDAEKGDAVLSLWANYDRYKTIKDVADAINIPYKTVLDNWCRKARKLSDRVKEYLIYNAVDRLTTIYLLKHSHTVQDKLAEAIVKNGFGQHQSIQFLKLYDANPKADLDELANKAKGIETVTLFKSELSPDFLEKIEEKRQLAKMQRIYRKPDKPITKITKEDVQKRQKKSKPETSFLLEKKEELPTTLEVKEVPREAILSKAEAIIARLEDIKHPYQRERMVEVVPKELEKLEKRLEKAPERRERVEHKLNRLYELEAEGIFLSTLWDIGERAEYAGSKEFHGNCPPQVVEQCVLRLTKKGDVVLDPMAGSGTAVDVCNLLDRKCIAYDIKSPKWRTDIIRNDSRKIPLDDNCVDMIFLHPPYWGMVYYTGNEDEEKLLDLSRTSTLEEYFHMLKPVLLECYRVLKPKKYLCILIGDRIKEGKFIPLCRKTANMSEEVGFTDCGYAVKFTSGATSSETKGQMIYAELAYTENLKVEHDLVMFFKKEK